MAALVLLLAGGAGAQVVTAIFYGTIVHPNGAVIPGARVTVLNVDRGSTLTREAGARGEVSFPSLPIGEYAITGEAKGFKTLKRTVVNLSAGQDLRLTLSLDIGQLAEVIEVKSETPPVNTANAEQGSNLESGRVQELPMARRDWTNLLNLTNLSGLQANVVSSSFGLFTGARGARVVYNEPAAGLRTCG